MTIRGALSNLDNLLKADDIPFYYKPSIKAVMDTIALSSSEKPNNSTTKNDKIDCQHTDCDNCVNHKYCDYEPTTKNNLGVDAVSRKAVHDMLENLPITVEDKWFNWLQKACMRLAELPSVTPQEPRWIPISERLPKEYEPVILSTDEEEVFIARYLGKMDDGTDCFDDEDGMMWEGDVIAWMPLPEPYKGESEG